MSDTSNPGAPPPTLVDDQFEGLLDGLQSNIGRYVTFVLTPLLLPLVGAGGLWLQSKIGFDIQQYGGAPAVVGFIVSTVAGTAGAILLWLRNRGNHERGAVESLVLLKAGQDAATSAAANPVPAPVPVTLVGSGGGNAVSTVTLSKVGEGEQFGGDDVVSDAEEFANPPEDDRPEAGQVPAPPQEG